ncbi:Arylsulfatase [Tetrabaena socialis]|uniref:Arylsulfatase n=1 Tax=Tetrabaena socialis TaxID=47790 RepID=A0A2J7ZLH3_9CHLO|nr:Arylsulfatase [Tetrabaena socialis]|eukprot:PNH01119.1 Arylsulfatase [Tetrabaena socialis]
MENCGEAALDSSRARAMARQAPRVAGLGLGLVQDPGSPPPAASPPPRPPPGPPRKPNFVIIMALSNWNLPLPNVLGIGPDVGEDINPKGIDRDYQRRLETMMSVDDLIESVVQRLDAEGVLDNTYIIYVSDNGYHLGNHGLPKGKTLPYEEDIRVPFYMRGPGVPPGLVSPYMGTMVDITSTLIALGGGTPPDRLDGVPLPLDRIIGGGWVPPSTAVLPRTNGTLRQMLPVEMWIDSLSKQIDKKDYRSVRICTNYTIAADGRTQTCWKYTIWCVVDPACSRCVWPTTTNYKELFDLGADPGEINNLMPAVDAGTGAGANPNMRRLLNRLDALLQVMGYCKGASCRAPWARVHPEGGVDSLEGAMNPAFDARYDSYTKYAWKSCQPYYDPVNNEVADKGLGGLSRWVS